jgi:polyisoprenoid-binding protein YceI
VTPDGSQVSALARSSIHPFTYRGTLTGEVNAHVVDGHFDVTEPITGQLEVDLDSLRADDRHVEGEMQRRLDTQRYPRAKASVQRVTASGDDAYWLSGELALHGKTRPLEGKATVTLDGEKLHATGTLTIDLRDFGVKPPRLAMLRVRPEIEISIDLIAQLDGG